MLKKAFEWLRAADLKPDDSMVASRTKAAEGLTDRIRKSKDYELLVGSVAAAVGGCERLGEQSAVVATLLECIRAQQPAFPGALCEYALQLRIVCCLGLGHLLESFDDEADNDELMAASLLAAGLGVKPREAGRHLDAVFDDLRAVARGSIQTRAVVSREREDLDWSNLKALESSAGDPLTFSQKLLPVIREIMETLEERQRCDREELEVMWWLYNGFSDRLGEAVRKAPPFLAAVAIGCEVADRVAPPATAGLSEVVAHAAIRDRAAAKTKAKPITQIVAELGSPGRSLLLPESASVQDLARGSGHVLPLSWLCIRLDESQGTSGWEIELKAKTGLVADRELTPNELAVQVFIERQAQRVYQSLTEE